jgi:hypothetical protein
MDERDGRTGPSMADTVRTPQMWTGELGFFVNKPEDQAIKN